MASPSHFGPAQPAPIVETAAGPVRGERDGTIAIFRGIPYAAPPLGRLRFRPPEAMARWREPREATRFGPIAPQLASRLSRVMGEFDLPQSEDCLTLNVWTPSPGSGRAPVLVFLHGGAFTSGSGQLGWYSGRHLAERGDIVVVTVSYRLGPLGFLYLPGLAAGNMGLLDQRAALSWIVANIAAFGGDPGRITLCGQSAGARSALIHMGDGETSRHIRGAILQSGPFGRLPSTPDEAARTAREFLAVLGLAAGETAALNAVPADRLLAAAAELARRGRQFANARVPFDTVGDGIVVPADPAAAAGRGAALDVAVMLGTTRDEAAAHFAFDPEILAADADAVERTATAWLGASGAGHLAELRRLWPQATAYSLLVHLATETTYAHGTIGFAEARAAAGRPAHLYRFDWQSPAPRVGACHCIDLPFAFGNFADWADAPMLAGADAGTLAGISRALQDAIIAFARTGRPDHDGIPPWEAYAPPVRTTMRFDTTVETGGDLAGMRWRRSLAPA